jgi:hypothetical protein
MAWLDDHPPVRSQFSCPRRETPSGVIVVHTAENTPDFVGFDGTAEAVANFIRTRTDAGSYHDLADSDSTVHLVEYSCEAYHDGTGSNRHSYGVSMATRADIWPFAPEEWRRKTVRNAAQAAARYAKWVRAGRGIIIPARRISRAQSEQRLPGFISHAERDPTRRTDPGVDFPWDQFLADYAEAMGPTRPPTEEDDMPNPALILRTPGRSDRLLHDGSVIGFASQKDRSAVFGSLKAGGVKIKLCEVSRGQFDGMTRNYNDAAQLEALEAIEDAIDELVLTPPADVDA